MWQNSYDGSPSVYIVPTPIGNLGDMTFRAIEVLKNVSVIFSEDTRITLQLLNYYDIKKLKYAERIVERSKPDAVIVLTYDAISLAFFRVKCPTFVINHVNFDFLIFWYRNLTTKLFPKNYIHVNFQSVFLLRLIFD